MSTIAPTTLTLGDVRTWRVDQLVAAGYALHDALVLSERIEVDLHLAVRLLRDGCPAGTALRILL